MADIVTDVKAVANNLRGLLEENRPGIREIVSNFKEASDTISGVLGTDAAEADLQNIISNVKLAVADLRDFSASIKEATRKENIERLDSILARFDTTMEDVELAAKNVRNVAEKVDKGEGTIGRLLSDDETLNEFEAAVKDIREVLSPAVKLKTAVDFHSELREDESTQHYFNVLLRTRPDKFYLLGFTDVTERRIETQTEDIEVQEPSDDATAAKRIRERIEDRKQIRFNLQLAKRWYFFQLRFGLFETTGGFAGDLFFFDDRVRFTVEAFDWRRRNLLRRTAHVKAYMSVLFFKHIYGLIGVDDITRLDPDTGKVNKKPNYFVGAGLNFDDEDLKAIFGTAALAL